jgi:hypothetical protein
MKVKCNGKCKDRSCFHRKPHEHWAGCFLARCRTLNKQVKCNEVNRRKAKEQG